MSDWIKSTPDELGNYLKFKPIGENLILLKDSHDRPYLILTKELFRNFIWDAKDGKFNGIF